MLFKKISPEIIEELLKQRLNLSHIYYLEALCNDIKVQVPDTIMQLLERRLLIANGEVTPQGKEFYQYVLKGKRPKKATINTSHTEEFKQWWNLFPATDNFEYNSRRFEGSRTLRLKREDCLIEFNKILSTGEYTAEQIINGTINHVEICKKQSYQKGDNKLTYLAAAPRYLKERMFSGYITIEKQKETNQEIYI